MKCSMFARIRKEHGKMGDEARFAMMTWPRSNREQARQIPLGFECIVLEGDVMLA